MKKNYLLLFFLLISSNILAQVGVNTTSVDAMLEVVGTENSSTTHSVKVSNENNKILFDILNDGNIGVGTSNPKVRLDLRGNNEEGSIGIGDSPQTPAQAGAGAIKYSNTTQKFYYAKSGSTWEEIVGILIKARITASITNTGNIVPNNTANPQAITGWTLNPDESNYMFDAATGVFTVPRDGLYTVTFSVNFEPGSFAADSFIEAIWKYSVGTNLDIKSISTYYLESPSGESLPTGVMCAGNLRMQQGETLTPLIWQNLGEDKTLVPIDTNLSIFEN